MNKKNIYKKIKYLGHFFILFAIILSGCVVPSAAALEGKWKADNDSPYLETIEFLETGKYFWKRYSENAEIEDKSGDWEFQKIREAGIYRPILIMTDSDKKKSTFTLEFANKKILYIEGFATTRYKRIEEPDSEKEKGEK